MRKRKNEVCTRPGTKVLQLRYYDRNGRLYRQSAETEDFAEAESRLAAILIELAKEPIPAAPLTGFDVFLDNRPMKPSTRKRYEISLEHFTEFCMEREINDFRQFDKKALNAFIEWRRKRGNLRHNTKAKGVSDTTIKRDVLFLSATWNFLLGHVDWEDIMPPSPVMTATTARLKEPKARARYLTSEERVALLKAALTPTHRKIITIALETGMREQEILNMTWRWVNFETRRILVPGLLTKNANSRTVPMSPIATDTLRDTVLHGANELVFPRADGSKYTSVNGWWGAVKRRAGITDIRFHDLRHTFASNWVSKGGHMLHLSNIMGHGNVAVTNRYTHLDAGAAQAEMDRIQG